MSAVKSLKANPQRTMCVAVVGTGNIGVRHLETLRRIKWAHRIAIPTRPERLRQLAAAGHLAARDLDHAVQMGATLCIVATDTSRHVEDGLAAIHRGLNVLIEKPLATNAQGARHLMAQAAAAHRNIYVGCVLRFSESLGAFRNLLDRVGALHTVRVECQSYLPDWRPNRPYQETYSARAEDGGVLRDLIHEIDYAGWLFGWPGTLQARVKNLGRLNIAAPELAELTWETSSGCVVSIALDYLSKPSRRRMRACGERGTIEWDGIRDVVTVEVDGTPLREVKSTQTRDEMFLAQARAFINASGSSPDPRLATGEDGVKALAVCDAAWRASESRREEPVEYP